MSDNVTPEEHSSVVGGSTASRRLNCPRSYTLEQLAPPDKGNAYAREGTALHEMIAKVLNDNVDPETLLPFTFSREKLGAEDAWSLTIDEDIWYEHGQPALDAFDAFIAQIEAETGAEFEFVIETRCAMPGIDEAFGTSDIIWKCGELSGVWDWKFGRTPVSADENSQLKFYARAAASTVPSMFGAKSWGEISPDREVVLSIMQPQCGKDPSSWRTTVGDLEAFRLDLMTAVKEAVTRGDKARVAKGSWCSFATCKSICPLYVKQSLAFGQKMAAIKDAQAEIKAKGLEEVDDFYDHAEELLELAEQAEEWAKAVFAAAHSMLTSGDQIEGWFLKAKKSSGREWTVSEEEVKKFMKNRRYTLDEYMPRKLASMPQCEKLLKRDGREIPEDMYRQKPSSGTSLARDGDPAPRVGTQAERLASLASKLKGLPQE